VHCWGASRERWVVEALLRQQIRCAHALWSLLRHRRHLLRDDER